MKLQEQRQHRKAKLWQESKETQGTEMRKWILKKQQNVQRTREITVSSLFAGQVKSYFKN